MNCSELRTKLAEIKTLKEELLSGLIQAQNHEDTLILVNLQEKIEKKLESLGEILPINIDKLERRHKEGKPLSKRELWFIYRLNKLFNRKTRVKGEDVEKRRGQIEKEREATRRQDLVKALDCREEEISLTQDEAMKGDIKYHHGWLDFKHLKRLDGNNLGDFHFDIQFPEIVNGWIEINYLKSIDGQLVLPRIIIGRLDLHNLLSAEGFVFPEIIYGDLDLHHLESAEFFNPPKFISGSIYLDGLRSLKNLRPPEKILGSIFLPDNLDIKDEEKEELKGKYPHLVDQFIF